MKYLTIILVFFFSGYGFSQSETDNDVLIKQLELLDQISLDLEFSNQAFIEQHGNLNDARIYQINPAGFSPNSVEIIQNGNSNFASISQNGSGNKNDIEQNGNDNSYDLNVSGENNITSVVQDGSGNSVKQDIIGTELKYIIIQRGNNHNLTQVENSPASVPYIIEQKGPGMNLIISNGGVR